MCMATFGCFMSTAIHVGTQHKYISTSQLKWDWPSFQFTDKLYICVSIRFTLLHFHTHSLSLTLVKEINLITFTRSVHCPLHQCLNRRKLIIYYSHTCSKSCEWFLIISGISGTFFAVGWTRKKAANEIFERNVWWNWRKHLDRLNAMRSSILIRFKWKTQFQYLLSARGLFLCIFFIPTVCRMTLSDHCQMWIAIAIVIVLHVIWHMSEWDNRMTPIPSPTHSHNNQINTLTSVASCRVLFCVDLNCARALSVRLATACCHRSTFALSFRFMAGLGTTYTVVYLLHSLVRATPIVFSICSIVKRQQKSALMEFTSKYVCGSCFFRYWFIAVRYMIRLCYAFMPIIHITQIFDTDDVRHMFVNGVADNLRCHLHIFCVAMRSFNSIRLHRWHTH